MISWLLAYKKPWVWVILHILLGYFSTLTPSVIIAYFYLVLFTSIRAFTSPKSNITLTILIAYLVPLEIICRMAQTSPFIPYELSKYLLFVLLVIGIFSGRNKGRIGLIMLILLLPALTIDLSNEVHFKDLVFNVLAPINLCLGVIYFYKQRIDIHRIKNILIALVLPLISALIFTYIKTPDYDDIDFQLGANVETTGGFGSNQVSTVFGLGMFLMFFLWYKRISLSGSRFFDGALLFLFVLQGLLSFSRGGMIGGALAILVFLFFEFRRKEPNKEYKKGIGKYLIPSVFLVLSTIWIANDITEGKLLLRYQGETEGTIAGSKEKDLNSITTNRADIFEGDVLLFSQNPFGVGAGASKYLRVTQNGVVSHIEFSRLIAEHGYLGLLFFGILTIIPFYAFAKKNRSSMKGFMVALFFLAWYTTFHAATRNFVTPLLIGISLITVINDKTPIPRKQAQ